MSDPYREGVPPSGLLDCPRCAKPLPPMDVATCPDECGTWVNATVAAIAFDAEEIRENRITRWWRVREPCPVCKEQMLLRGFEDQELFQGCTKHGYWIDVDTVGKTGLARPGLFARLRKMREDEDAHRAALAKRKADAEAAALEAAKRRKEREREQEQARQQKELARQKAREDAQKEVERQRVENDRLRAEKQRAKEEATRKKSEAKRAAKELDAQMLEQRRTQLTASVKSALEAKDPEPIVHELLRLEGLITEMSKRFGKLSSHFVFEDDD